MTKTSRGLAAALLLLLASLPALAADVRAADGEVCTTTSLDWVRAGEVNGLGHWSYRFCVTRFEVLFTYRLLPWYAISQPWVYWAQAMEAGAAPADMVLQVPYVAEGDPTTDALKFDMLRDVMQNIYRPSTPRWAVAANGLVTTRPTYPYVAGVRGTASNGRVNVGAACDCAMRSVEGSAVYCGVRPSSAVALAASVAVCQPLPPSVPAPIPPEIRPPILRVPPAPAQPPAPPPPSMGYNP